MPKIKAMPAAIGIARPSRPPRFELLKPDFLRLRAMAYPYHVAAGENSPQNGAGSRRNLARLAQGVNFSMSAEAASESEAREGTHCTLTVPALAARIRPTRTIALVGLMGAGKSAIGKRLAKVLNLPFRDADHEIEIAAGRSVSDIFAERGEAEFRRGERQVLARLLREPRHVLATGGGAFMDETTRAVMRECAVSVWLKADVETLFKRISRRSTRPLLQTADPRKTLEHMLAQRAPIYALADLHVDSVAGPPACTLELVLLALDAYFSARPAKSEPA